MKRELSFLAFALLALPLVGCGGSGDNDNDNPNPVGDFFVAVRDQQLVRGDVNNADRATSTPITGLPVGVQIVGLDYRPANGSLIALAENNRLYTISLATASASEIGAAALDPALTGGAFGFDFNPVVDRIRVIGDDGQNLRLNPDTGAVAASDTTISDVNADIVGAAYTNNFAGTATTTLYAIDANSDSLVMIGGPDSTPSPNGGALTIVAPLGLELTTNAGFDIGAGNRAYMVSGDNVYSVNLATGATAQLSTFDDNVDAFTIVPAS